MPGLEKKSKEQLLIHQFMAGLPADMSQQLCATGETKEFAAVVERAPLLMAIDSHDPLQGSAAITQSACRVKCHR